MPEQPMNSPLSSLARRQRQLQQEHHRMELEAQRPVPPVRALRQTQQQAAGLARLRVQVAALAPELRPLLDAPHCNCWEGKDQLLICVHTEEPGTETGLPDRLIFTHSKAGPVQVLDMHRYTRELLTPVSLRSVSDLVLDPDRQPDLTMLALNGFSPLSGSLNDWTEMAGLSGQLRPGIYPHLAFWISVAITTVPATLGASLFTPSFLLAFSLGFASVTLLTGLIDRQTGAPYMVDWVSPRAARRHRQDLHQTLGSFAPPMAQDAADPPTREHSVSTALPTTDPRY